MPLGLTHASVTFQYNILLQRLLLLFDALITYSRTHDGHLRQMGETQCIVDKIMTSQLRHMVEAWVDRYMIRDDVTHCRGSVCSAPKYTLREMIERELHDTPSVGHFKALYEHGAQWMVGLFYRKACGLQAVIGYITKRRDSILCCVIRQKQGSLAGTILIHDTWCQSISCQCYQNRTRTGGIDWSNRFWPKTDLNRPVQDKFYAEKCCPFFQLVGTLLTLP